jgi:hypothetical protein
MLQTLHRKHNIEQHQPHYNWGEHRCSKHYTENKLLNNTNPTTTGVNTGAPNTTTVVVGLVLFNIVFSV